MVDIVDLQHATQLSNRLELFKIKATNPYRINFRCPICGDSRKSKVKARGWLIEDKKDQSIHFFCHNCGASLSFQNFLKAVDPTVHKDYITAKYIDRAKTSGVAEVDPQAFKTNTPKMMSDPLKKIKKISQLKADHPVKKYIQNRQIPPHQHYRMYYAPKFKTWINSIFPGKFDRVDDDHPRLILPFIGQDGKCFGVTGRGFDPDGLRYLTIMFEDRHKIFGLDKVDFKKPYFVVEGPIDSFFLDNAIAMAGADGSTEGLPNPEKATLVYDCEPRNKEIVKRMEKAVRQGLKVCVWPESVERRGKDINDLFLSGLSSAEIQNIITTHTYKGLEASLMIAKWKRT